MTGIAKLTPVDEWLVLAVSGWSAAKRLIPTRTRRSGDVRS